MIQLQQQDREVAGVMISTSLTEAESGRLLELAVGKLVLEIGSSYGYSTVLMATVARHVITVDCFDNELVGHGSGTGGEDENRRAALGWLARSNHPDCRSQSRHPAEAPVRVRPDLR